MAGMMKAAMLACAMVAMVGAMPASAADTVYVIRHMQKADGADPSLNAEGRAAAASLADLLAEKGITAIYATPTRRAMETAAPIAIRVGLSVTPYDPADPAALIKAATAANGRVLIIGHSNTVPELVALFGGDRPPAIGEEDFGTLYIVRTGSSEVDTVHVGGRAH